MKKSIVAICLILSFAGASAVLAQDDPDCATIVVDALETVDTSCEGIGRNEVCYGNRLIDVDLQSDTDAIFGEPGDLTTLSNIHRLHTTQMNLDTGDWGIALMKVQANLPDTLPGQNVTFMLTGDVMLTDVSEEEGTAPMQAFYFTAGIGNITCQSAPNNLVIQSPQGTKVNLTVNDTDIELGSTAVFEITADGNMDVLLVGGSGEVTADGASEIVPAGQVTTITLNDEGLATTAPTTSQPYNTRRIQYIPFSLLPEVVHVPANAGWVNTGVILATGQTYTISASGLATTCSFGCPGTGYDTWVTPVGLPTGPQCPAKIEDIPPNIDLCKCQGSRGACILDGIRLMVLTARIGGGEPFIVSSGGTFTAKTSGLLELTVNDDDFSDNDGTFTAIVTALGEGDDSGSVVLPAGCFVSATQVINLRTGAGTSFSITGQLTAGTYLQIVGQTEAIDGFVWWQLGDAVWVRSDIVSESGICTDIPTIPASE